MATVPELDPEQVAALGQRIAANVRRAVKVPDETLRSVIVALLSEGHVLIEDYPGVGKTALARALARSVDAEYARIQCTADLLPADVVGTNVFNQREARFEFRPGPVFANVVLVDEINRASPKTQSGLLECMQERHVTVDVHTHELARPFIVIATQNPIEYEGTYPLPEAQLDRFMVRAALGYPAADDEADMLSVHAAGDRVLDLQPVAAVGEVLAAQQAAAGVHASEALRRYVVAILDQTRSDPRTELGASPRAGLMLLKAAKALAALDGRDHALPDDVQVLAPSVLTHRLLLAPDAAGGDRVDVVRDALERVPALWPGCRRFDPGARRRPSRRADERRRRRFRRAEPVRAGARAAAPRRRLVALGRARVAGRRYHPHAGTAHRRGSGSVPRPARARAGNRAAPRGRARRAAARPAASSQRGDPPARAGRGALRPPRTQGARARRAHDQGPARPRRSDSQLRSRRGARAPARRAARHRCPGCDQRPRARVESPERARRGARARLAPSLPRRRARVPHPLAHGRAARRDGRAAARGRHRP